MIGDRFLILDNGRTLDLASGRCVTVLVTPSEGRSRDMEWTERCANLARLRHPLLATLVDFGCGPTPSERFEAFDLAPGPVRIERRQLPGAARSLVAFLNAQGCAAERADLGSLQTTGVHVHIVPGPRVGYSIREAGAGEGPRPANEAGRGPLEPLRTRNLTDTVVRFRGSQVNSRGPRPTRWVGGPPNLQTPAYTGVTIQRPPVADVIVDMVEAGRPGESRALSVSGPAGAGISTLLALLSREVRLRGFLPISTVTLVQALHGGPFAYSDLLRLVTGRHVVVLDDGSEGQVMSAEARAEALARFVIDLGDRDTRPHRIVVGLTGHERASLSIDAFSVEALRRMVSLSCSQKRADRAIARAAKAADGRPGPFLETLRRTLDGSHAAPVRPTRYALVDGSATVRESAPSYGAEPAHEARRVGSTTITWRACLSSAGCSDPVATRCGSVEIRGKARLACDILRRGEHARGERLLRDSLGGLIRRDDHGAAAVVALVLGQLTWRKGRTREATSFLATSRLQFELARQTAGMVPAAVFAGLTATDEGRLIDAEAGLRSALLAASRVDEGIAVASAGLALARCLLWQARYDEAERQLQQVRAHLAARGAPPIASPDATLRPEAFFEPDEETSLEDLAAQVCLGLGDVPRAGRHASASLERATLRGTAIDWCVAHAANAGVQARVGDLAALRAHVADGVTAARRAHLPLEAIRLRLHLLEGLWQAGRVGECRTLAGKLTRVRESTLPPLLRIRYKLVMTQITSSGSSSSPPASVETFVESTGARHVLADRADRHREANPPDVLHEIVEILQMCHDAEDERMMLADLCTRLRERLRAGAVTFWAARDGVLSAVVSTSNRHVASDVAARALTCALALGPTASAEGSEAAVPVRYGGAAIAVLSVRWHPDPVVDTAKAMLIVRAAAASAAPAVRGLLDRTAVSTVTAGVALESELLGTGEVMENLRRALSRAARAPFAVLIEGESGTGKELAARAIHRLSPRRDRKFCAVNCAALNDELIEAELFGHTRGAFTGAVGDRVGLFEEADGGTLFLDEVGELSMRAQVKILRAIQEGEIRRVGESFHRKVDVRLVAATNRSLEAEVATGRFRQDLFYRIHVIRMSVPPLRERIEDIPVLARHFWNQAVQRTGSRATLGPMALAALTQYGWPGNVRELQNVMSALAVSAPTRGSIGASHLPGSIGRAATNSSVSTLEEARRLFERRYVEAALARAGGHRGRAAAALGLSRQGLSKLLARLDLTASDEPVRVANPR